MLLSKNEKEDVSCREQRNRGPEYDTVNKMAPRCASYNDNERQLVFFNEVKGEQPPQRK
jgi:hypothetical protein